MKIKLLFLGLFCAGISHAAEPVVIEDFESYAAGTEMNVFRIYGGSAGQAVVESDPKDSGNKALHFTTSSWNAFPQLTLTLPAGTTLADYSAISFDLYRMSDDEDYKVMDIRIDSKILFQSTYVHHADTGKWTNKKYDLNGFDSDGSTFTISLGVNTPAGNYYIDNIAVKKAADIGYDIDDDLQTLRYWAEACGKKIGMSVSNTDNGFWSLMDIDNNMMNKTLYRNFNMVVAGNEMKFDALEPAQGEFSFANADRLVEYAEQHGMAVRGHTLCWHSQLPGWLNAGSDGSTNGNNYTKQQLLDILKNHITTVVSHYKGRVKEWDVVNEMLSNGGGSMRGSIWYKVIGEAYIDSAFVWAHRADPDAILYINDYSAEEMGTTKGDALYNLAKRLVSRKVPIHGVGLQTHVTAGKLDFTKVENNVKRYAELGLNCIFTEVDVKISKSQFGKESAWQLQAGDYYNLALIQLRNANCPNLVIWGIADPISWIIGETGGSYGEPLIFSDEYVAKPAFFKLRDAYRQYRESGIESITPDIDGSTPDYSRMYDLTGRKVGPGYKGLVISNGRKFILR